MAIGAIKLLLVRGLTAGELGACYLDCMTKLDHSSGLVESVSFVAVSTALILLEVLLPLHAGVKTICIACTETAGRLCLEISL